MNEKQFVESFIKKLDVEVKKISRKLFAESGKRVSYANEIITYLDTNAKDEYPMKFETDVLIYEKDKSGVWKPRIIIETKLHISTHDAITYSQKAFSHKHIHPYLRYGILLGDRGKYPIPGRLFRHGLNFDFMLSWKKMKPSKIEWNSLMKIIKSEINASKNLEEMIYNSRYADRKKINILHKPLIIK